MKNKEADEYGITLAKAKSYYSRYKKTGNNRLKRKADRYYGSVDFMLEQVRYPGTKVTVNKTEIKDSFKYQKNQNVGLNGTKVSFPLRKQKSKKLK